MSKEERNTTKNKTRIGEFLAFKKTQNKLIKELLQSTFDPKVVKKILHLNAKNIRIKCIKKNRER